MQVIRKMEAMYSQMKSYMDTDVYSKGNKRITFWTSF